MPLVEAAQKSSTGWIASSPSQRHTCLCVMSEPDDAWPIVALLWLNDLWQSIRRFALRTDDWAGRAMAFVDTQRLQSAASRLLRGVSLQRNFEALRDVWRLTFANRELISEMSRREIGSGHAGHTLGPVWVFIHPLLIVGIYLLIFGFVIGQRIAPTDKFPGDFPSYIMIGLAPWLAVQAALIKSSSALVANSSLVKQVVFPIEILPVSAVAAATMSFVPAIAVAILYRHFFGGGLPMTALLLPVVFALHVMLCVGIAFALSALTCFMRDLREMVNVFCVVAMYATPAVYLPEWVPSAFRPLLYLNPFSYLTWIYQDTLFFGKILHPWAWVVTFILALAALCGGYRLFKRLGPYYGNVL
jgi:lipopolysaccharide transport system permease protein